MKLVWNVLLRHLILVSMLAMTSEIFIIVLWNLLILLAKSVDLL